jgi:capsular polysaccharide export protein
VLVWGHSQYAPRGEAAAKATGATLVRVEDAFLRSLHPGRAGEPPLGLVIDRTGMHFDATRPSDLETLLARHPLDNTALLDRARDVMARMATATCPNTAPSIQRSTRPIPGFVLDRRPDPRRRLHPAGRGQCRQFRRDADMGAAGPPRRDLVIKTHPETQAAIARGISTPTRLPPGVVIEDRPISPWRLFEHARAVYTVSSQLGFEAILAGHRPVTFGVPFYAGWGLTDDRRPVPARRGPPLTRAQLVAAALILYPPGTTPTATVSAPSRTCSPRWRRRPAPGGRIGTATSRSGCGIGNTPITARSSRPPGRAWVRGRHRPAPSRTAARCRSGPAARTTCSPPPAPARKDRLLRVEDGFLRSRGLGARLVPPLSLVQDDLGIYYDPTPPAASNV